jgi:hypothetical protein
MKQVWVALAVGVALSWAGIRSLPRRAAAVPVQGCARGAGHRGRAGEAEVLLVIASMRRANWAVAGRSAALGGTVQNRVNEVDYLRARVPVDRVEELAQDPGVHFAPCNPGQRMRCSPTAGSYAPRP